MWGLLIALLGTAAAAAAAFTISFRTGFRPVQDVVRRFNRDVTNRRVLDTAGSPGAYASVVHHVGRRSGTAYRTPVVAVRDGSAFLFALPYGPGADWVRNVVAAGSATLDHEGATFEVDRPEVVTREVADPWFGRREQRMHAVFGVNDFLLVRTAGTA